MIQAILLMAGLGAFCGLVLSAASRIFYVYEDPRIRAGAGLSCWGKLRGLRFCGLFVCGTGCGGRKGPGKCMYSCRDGSYS